MPNQRESLLNVESIESLIALKTELSAFLGNQAESFSSSTGLGFAKAEQSGLDYFQFSLKNKAGVGADAADLTAKMAYDQTKSYKTVELLLSWKNLPKEGLAIELGSDVSAFDFLRFDVTKPDGNIAKSDTSDAPIKAALTLSIWLRPATRLPADAEISVTFRREIDNGGSGPLQFETLGKTDLKLS